MRRVRGFGWLSVLGRIVQAVVSPQQTFPPMPFCPICHRPTKWKVQGESWGCEFHTFTVSGAPHGDLPVPPQDGTI